MAKLNPEEIQKALPSIALWSFSDERGGVIRQTFTFPDFKKAFGFMSKMADFSESIDHHPEWFNVYRRVEITLTTHDSGGLSEKDINWAREADRVGAQLQGEEK